MLLSGFTGLGEIGVLHTGEILQRIAVLVFDAVWLGVGLGSFGNCKSCIICARLFGGRFTSEDEIFAGMTGDSNIITVGVVNFETEVLGSEGLMGTESMLLIILPGLETSGNSDNVVARRRYHRWTDSDFTAWIVAGFNDDCIVNVCSIIPGGEIATNEGANIDWESSTWAVVNFFHVLEIFQTSEREGAWTATNGGLIDSGGDTGFISGGGAEIIEIN